MYKLVSNTYSKTSLPNLKIQFDTNFEQDKFVDHLKKLEFDGINWVSVTGVVDVVRIQGEGAGGDPVSAIANGVGELAKIATTLLANRNAKKSREQEVRDMQMESDLLSPMIEKIYQTFPFIATAYQERQRQAIAKVHNSSKEANNQAWADLNALLRNIVLSVTNYSAHKVQFLERQHYPVSYVQIDFRNEFADYFRKNPSALPPSIATNTTSTNNPSTPRTPANTNILPYAVGAFILYSLFQQPTKKPKRK